MKNKKGLSLILSGVFLILCAGILCAYNLYDSKRAGDNAAEAAAKMSEYIEAMRSEADSYTESEEIEFIPDYILNPEMDMPVTKLDGLDYVGMLEIPSLGISLPVLNECNDRLLKIAPCRYSGSAYLGGFVIGAHNYSSHFANIKNLQSGDTVIFTDTKGNSFEYGVIYQESLEPYDVDAMKSEDWELTLFTCTPGGQFRVTVRCMKIR